jgi:predicted aspartyl protease
MVETRRQKLFNLKTFSGKKVLIKQMMQRSRLPRQAGSVIIPISLQINSNTIIVADALLDSGASVNVINSKFAKEFKIPLEKETRNLNVFMSDGTVVSSVSRKTETIKSRVGNKMTTTPHIDDQVILGLPWLKDNKPNIDWDNPTRVQSWF